jgi:WD40 repeat protein/energy-coupling factor transporter ATP-binding protein EcfA2
MSSAVTFNTQSSVKTGKSFNPFPGLRPFGIDESHLFFGREGQSDEVLEKLSDNKFVGVIGSSGSGKSSLMYCGLIPELYGGFITGAGSSWKVVITRPGGGPIDNLAKALVESDGKELTEKDRFTRESISSAVLKSSSLGLVDAVRQMDLEESENVLIFVDQFEELFRFKKSRKDSSSVNESAAFVKLLLEAINQSDFPIYVVLTMRSDFIGDCSQYPELTKKINTSHYLIPQMTREDFRQAIIGPVAVGQGVISDRLVQQLLNDVGDNPDQLPILQHALMRTWDYWVKNKEGKESMDVGHYEAIGKMKKALSEHANEAYDELEGDGQEICENLFKTLTEKGADGRGIRHPSSVEEAAEIADTTPEKIIEVIEHFRLPGRSFLAPASHIKITSDTIIDISHESLMRVWDRLIQWVDEEVDSVQLYQRICEGAEIYQEGTGSLWRPPDLLIALNWKEKRVPNLTWAKRYNPSFERAMVFLESSREAYELEETNKILQQKRELRRTRTFAMVLGSAAIVALGLMIFSWAQYNQADKLRHDAELAKEDALNQKSLAEAATLDAQTARDAAQKSAVEAESARKDAERQAEIAMQEKKKAEDAKNLAEARKIEAEKATRVAITAQAQAEANAQEATRQTLLAQEANDKSQALRMSSIARSMAVKSLQIQNDTSLKALVSQQAYLFDKKYGDQEFNPDVYAGLYYSTKFLSPPDYNGLVGHDDGVRSIIFKADGSTMYTTGSDGKVLSWDMTKPDRPNKLVWENQSLNRSLTLSPDEDRLAVITQFSTIQVFKLPPANKLVWSLLNDDKVAWSIVFEPHQNTLLASYDDGSVVEWNLDNGTSKVLTQYDTRFISLDLTPDARWIAGGTEEGQVIIWDRNDPSKPAKIFGDVKNTIHGIRFNNKGDILATGDLAGNVRIWKVGTWELLEVLEGHSARVHDIQFSEDDMFMATGSFDKTVSLWFTEDFNRSPAVLDDQDSWVWSVGFSPDGTSVFAGCVNNLIREYPLEMDKMAGEICGKIDRNLTAKEWTRFVAKDILVEKTCENYPIGE